jgi:hypothetical protein
MKRAEYWQRIDHGDPRALEMADRHYSRQSPGTPEFIPAGHKIVLMHFAPDGTPAALWASHRPAPGIAVRQDGRDCWACTMFRVEQRTVLASELIKEAVAITAGLWNPLPVDGFITTVNPKFVPSQGRKRGHGWCYKCAGWIELEERTKSRNLIILMLPYPALAAVEPLAADISVPPFGTAWRRWRRKPDADQGVLL